MSSNLTSKLDILTNLNNKITAILSKKKENQSIPINSKKDNEFLQIYETTIDIQNIESSKQPETSSVLSEIETRLRKKLINLISDKNQEEINSPPSTSKAERLFIIEEKPTEENEFDKIVSRHQTIEDHLPEEENFYVYSQRKIEKNEIFSFRPENNEPINIKSEQKIQTKENENNSKIVYKNNLHKRNLSEDLSKNSNKTILKKEKQINKNLLKLPSNINKNVVKKKSMDFGRKIEITEKKNLCNHKIDEKKCRVLEMENTPLLKVNLQEINFLRKKLKENNKLDEEKNIYKAKPIIATRRGILSKKINNA